MVLLAELVTEAHLAGLTTHGLATGLQDLDGLTRGLLPGTLWVLLGTPGVGRTVLACQLAAAAAAAGGDTVLVLAREPAGTAVANIVCSLGRISDQHLRSGRLTEQDTARLHTASEALAAYPLRVCTPLDDVWEFSAGSSVPEASHWLGSGKAPRRVARVLLLDDLDCLTSDAVLDVVPRLRRWARNTGQTIVVTTPEEGLLDGDTAVPTLRRESDVLLRLQRPDSNDPDHLRVGKADLIVLCHREGPTANIPLEFQGHYRRFVSFDDRQMA